MVKMLNFRSNSVSFWDIKKPTAPTSFPGNFNIKWHRDVNCNLINKKVVFFYSSRPPFWIFCQNIDLHLILKEISRSFNKWQTKWLSWPPFWIFCQNIDLHLILKEISRNFKKWQTKWFSRSPYWIFCQNIDLHLILKEILRSFKKWQTKWRSRPLSSWQITFSVLFENFFKLNLSIENRHVTICTLKRVT